MADSRNSREMSTRAATVRTVWAPPSTLPEVTPQEGYAYRWIATHVYGRELNTNVSLRMREGWVPVKAADHPEVSGSVNASGNVEFGGLMLCKMPVEMVRARDEHYAQRQNAQATSIDNNFLRENDPRMPLFNEKRSQVVFGRGT